MNFFAFITFLGNEVSVNVYGVDLELIASSGFVKRFIKNGLRNMRWIAWVTAYSSVENLLSSHFDVANYFSRKS